MVPFCDQALKLNLSVLQAMAKVMIVSCEAASPVEEGGVAFFEALLNFAGMRGRGPGFRSLPYSPEGFFSFFLFCCCCVCFSSLIATFPWNAGSFPPSSSRLLFVPEEAWIV